MQYLIFFESLRQILQCKFCRYAALLSLLFAYPRCYNRCKAKQRCKMLYTATATQNDLDEIVSIYRRAQDFMIETGNPHQWGRTHPSIDLIKQDIQNGVCTIVRDDSGIHGVFALICGDDPTYAHIDGKWLNNEKYVTIHRIASDGKVHGIFECALTLCKTLSNNTRVDTHADNLVMQSVIQKYGFEKCGIIYVADGSPRIAYHLAMP